MALYRESFSELKSHLLFIFCKCQLIKNVEIESAGNMESGEEGGCQDDDNLQCLYMSL